ncbi:MAG TPA: hypothetical protein VGF55_27200 [Gemmataceae bacterium]|jgi:hypothetical protein
MNLLARTARDLRRLWSSDLGLTLLVAAVAVALEAIGRQTARGGYDLHDLIALFILTALAVSVLSWHRKSPLGWVTALAAAGRRAGRWLRRGTFEIGLDLRGDPPVRRGTPPIVFALAVGLAVWAAAAAWLAPDCPHRLRTLAAGTFYLGYLAALAAVWLGLMAVSLLAAFLPWALIHDRFVAAHAGPGRRPRTPEYVARAVYYGGLMFAGLTLPVAVALAWCAVVLVAFLAVCRLPAHGDVRFLWRPHGTVRVRSLPWGAWVTWEFVLITLAVVALVLTALGDRVVGAAGPETMPVTALLGLVLAWLAPGALTALFLQMALGRYHDPARPARPVASVAGAVADRAGLRTLFARNGWAVRFGRAAAGGVGVELVESKLPTEADEPHWPLPVTLAELESDAGTWERLRRRDEVQARRKVVAGLERLFKVAAGRPAKGGSGYWVAPHFWFVAGLMRDGEGDADLGDDAILSRTVGPPYHRVLSHAARHHAYRLMRAVRVDLIFVEDGVTFRRLRKVLRVLFEVYDVHGGRRPAEEVDFRGLPGTRVLIHDFQFDEPFKSEVYPEPKYDYLGRARILHVFRDRGEQEEPLESPFDFGRTPAPAAIG